MEKVLILLATYNGEKYINEMIDSIINQDYTNWHLILSDDSSSDSTAKILEEYAEKNSDRITHYKSGLRFGNAQNHFMHLLNKYHNSPYIMFCDQDDVWHRDKIKKTLNKMKETECNPENPAMVHTDLCVVNQNLDVIDSSFMHFSRLKGDRLSLNNLLVQNVVTGCTMMINRSLAELSLKNLPESGMLMHDWWLALIAAACGKVGFLNEATIDYRQHSNNVVGAKNASSFSYILKRITNNEARIAIKKTFIQAKALYQSCDSFLNDKEKKLIKDYFELENKKFFERRKMYICNNYLKCGFTRKMGQMIWG